MIINQLLLLIQEGKLGIFIHDQIALHSNPGSALEDELPEVLLLTLETTGLKLMHYHQLLFCKLLLIVVKFFVTSI